MKPKRVPIFRRAVWLGILLALPAAALANTRFMKIAGITGDVTLADPRLVPASQTGWIELAATNGAISVPVNSGFLPGIPLAGDLLLARPAGRFSPELFDALCRSTHFSTVEIREYLPGTPLALDRSILLENVLLGSLRNLGSGGDSAREELTLRYQKLTVSDPRSAAAKYDFLAAIVSGPTTNNRPPTLAAITAQATAEDTPLNVTLTIGDPDPGSVLTVTASSDNATLLPAGALAISGSGATRTLTLTPAPDQNGSATVSVIVSDGLVPTARSFTLTVTPVNDAPTLGNISAQTTPADTFIDVPFTVADIDTALTSVTATGTSSDTAILPNSGISISGSGNTRNVRLTPAAGAYGSVTVNLVANDGSADSAPRTFQLNVTPPPTAPTDIAISANTVAENSPAGTVIGTLLATDINGGPHTFEILSPVGGPFAISGNQLVVAVGANLDFESTTAYVLSIRATDGSALTYTGPLTINVTPVNEPPTFGGLPTSPLAVLRGQTVPLPGFSVADPDATDLSVTLTAPQGTLDVTSPAADVAVVSNGAGLITLTGPLAALNTTLSAGHLSLTGAANFPAGAPQTLSVALSVSDNGQSGAGGTLTANGSIPLRFYRHRIELWREAHFNAAELANAAFEATLWGNTADPDGDGLNNVGEYAFNRDPRDADGDLAPQPILALAPDAKQHLHLVVVVRNDDPELTVSFESGDSPANLSAATVVLTNSQVFAPGYDVRTLRDTLAVPDAPRRFIRASVNLQYAP